jgi:protease I
MAAAAPQKLAVVFAEDGYECLELHYPRLRLVEAGYKVEVIGPNPGQTYKSKEGYWAVSSMTKLEDIDPSTVNVVVVPGGFCTDRLRRHPAICDWLHAAWAEGKGATVSFICHGAWLPISAKIIKGMKCTCFFAIKDDLINAGAVYSEEKCVTDGKMVTAQTPEDLPAFMAAVLAIPNDRK